MCVGVFKFVARIIAAKPVRALALKLEINSYTHNNRPVVEGGCGEDDDREGTRSLGLANIKALGDFVVVAVSVVVLQGYSTKTVVRSQLPSVLAIIIIIINIII